MSRASFVCAVFILAVGQPGCGRETNGMIPVVGTITLDDAPLPEASVLFVPESGRIAYGVTDTEGRFRLTTASVDDGAAPGDYKIAVSLGVQSATEVDEKGLEGRQTGRAPVSIKSLIPLRYADPNGSGLRASIDLNNREVALALSSKK